MRCKGLTKSGKKCKNPAIDGMIYCRYHTRSNERIEEQNVKLIFNDALYYPTINILDEQWLKNAAFYWNSISTIVPSTISPYKRGVAKTLFDAGVLQPLYVNSDMPELTEVAEDFQNYLLSDEAIELAQKGGSLKNLSIHSDKMSRRLFRIHPEKLRHELLYELKERYNVARQSDGWLHLPAPYVWVYMTILATRLGMSKGRSILTNMASADKFSSKIAIGQSFDPRNQSNISMKTAEGLMASVIIRALKLRSNVSVRKILKFREKHEIELARFRKVIRELVSSLSGKFDFEALNSHLNSVHREEIGPAVEELKAKLRENNISCGFSHLKASLLSTAPPTILGSTFAAAGLGPLALAAGVGLSVVMQSINYGIQRKNILRKSPYSYVLSLEKEFARRN